MRKMLFVFLAVVMAVAFLTSCDSIFKPEEPWIPKSWAPLMGYSRLARTASDGTIQTVDNRVTIYLSWEGDVTKTMSPDPTQEGCFTYQAEQKIEAPQSGLKEYRVRAVDHLFWSRRRDIRFKRRWNSTHVRCI